MPSDFGPLRLKKSTASSSHAYCIQLLRISKDVKHKMIARHKWWKQFPTQTSKSWDARRPQQFSLKIQRILWNFMGAHHHDCMKHVTGFPFAPCGPPSPGGSVLNLKNWSRKTKSYYNPIRRQIKRHAMPNPFALHRVSGNDASCGRTFVWLHRFILFTPAVGSLPRVLAVTYVFHVFNILIYDFIIFILLIFIRTRMCIFRRGACCGLQNTKGLED